MFCSKCGKEIADDVAFCQFCGQQVGGAVNVQPQIQIVQVQQPKSQFIAIVLCLFLGLLGIHDFYMNKNGCGLAKLLIILLTGWIYIGIIINGLWCILDFILIITKSDKCFYNESGIKE